MDKKDMNEKDIILKLLDRAEAGGWMDRGVLDVVLLECWGNEHDARMHCNSMMRRGFLDYYGDGDYKILVTREEMEAAAVD